MTHDKGRIDRRRYRKISTCIHGDDKVRELSRPTKANARDLWFYLLTGPHTTSLPGLFRASFAQLADENGWKTRGTAIVFDEIRSRGMAEHDPKARVFWLPNALKHNEPESPNVIRGWRVHFDELPDSPLKVKALQTFRAHFEAREAAYPPKDPAKGFLEAFREAFPEAFGEAFREGWRHPSRNQEQEQEQEQEQDLPPSPKEGGRASAPGSAFDAFWEAYPRKAGRGAARKAWDHLSPDDALAASILAAVERQRQSPQWTRDEGRYVPEPAKWLAEERWQDAVGQPKVRSLFQCPHSPRCEDEQACHLKLREERAAQVEEAKRIAERRRAARLSGGAS